METFELLYFAIKFRRVAIPHTCSLFCLVIVRRGKWDVRIVFGSDPFLVCSCMCCFGLYVFDSGLIRMCYFNLIEYKTNLGLSAINLSLWLNWFCDMI